jgi:hypothetical protein
MYSHNSKWYITFISVERVLRNMQKNLLLTKKISVSKRRHNNYGAHKGQLFEAGLALTLG